MEEKKEVKTNEYIWVSRMAAFAITRTGKNLDVKNILSLSLSMIIRFEWKTKITRSTLLIPSSSLMVLTKDLDQKRGKAKTERTTGTE